MWHANDGMGWWMIFGMIWMVLFWGTIIALIVWAISRFAGSSSTTEPRVAEPRPQEDSALEIAQKRYARGEITRDEFEQLRRDLA